MTDFEGLNSFVSLSPGALVLLFAAVAFVVLATIGALRWGWRLGAGFVAAAVLCTIIGAGVFPADRDDTATSARVDSSTASVA